MAISRCLWTCKYVKNMLQLNCSTEYRIEIVVSTHQVPSHGISLNQSSVVSAMFHAYLEGSTVVAIDKRFVPGSSTKQALTPFRLQRLHGATSPECLELIQVVGIWEKDWMIHNDSRGAAGGSTTDLFLLLLFPHDFHVVTSDAWNRQKCCCLLKHGDFS